MKLNSQEIRNCIYGGQFNDFIKSLAKDKDFQSLIKKFEPKRYIAEELCVRFMALYDKLNLYKGNMKNFLNNYYEEKQFLDDFSKIDFENYVKENKKTFIDCILACKIVFEQNAFKKINKYEHPVNGKTFEYGSFSKMVFDMQMLGFASFDLASVRRNAEKIREKYIQILLKYPEMEPCTKNNKSTAARIKKWQDCIGKIINE